MYKIKVNQQWDFEVELQKGELSLFGEHVSWDMTESANGNFHIIQNGKSYSVQVIEAKYEEKAFTIRVNGNDYTLQVKDKYDLLLQQLGLSDKMSSKVNDIKAPMPGLVLNILVEDGQTVKKGDSILILEAMKMENVLKSPGDGTVKTVKVQKGDAVEKGQVLILMG
ncbi:MAG: biotin/lipoyl-containing protein [Chitinophagales bacterium]|nr:biotin/lipoyl-containing protein [Chitinophagales bacterium]